MHATKQSVSYQLIPKDRFEVCRIDGVTLKAICRMYTAIQIGKKVAYSLDKLSFYLREKHAIDLKEYIVKYLGVEWPKCPIKGDDLGYMIGGYGVKISMFRRGAVRREFIPSLDSAYRRFSEERKGEGNPMFGREGWCKGLTKDTDDRLRTRAEQQTGRKASDETRAKQRSARARHPLKARHTTPHSAETKIRARENTARLWAEGVFNRTSSIHIKMREFLTQLELTCPWKEEKQVKYFSMDFAFPSRKIAIECQGSYYHVDPRIYPNGPINAMQRRNFGRDKAKREVCCNQNGWVIIEVWEPEINDGTFKDTLKCKLKELGLLKN